MSLPVQVLVVSLSWSPVTTPTPTHIFVTQKFFANAHLTTYQRCVQYIKGFVYRIVHVPGKWLEAEAAKYGGRQLHRGSAWAVQLSCASAHPRSDRSYRTVTSPMIIFKPNEANAAKEKAVLCWSGPTCGLVAKALQHKGRRQWYGRRQWPYRFLRDKNGVAWILT